MDRCPCCNARLTGQLSCPRCQANLADVTNSNQQGQCLLEQAMQLWFSQEPKLALLVLAKALTYKKTPAALVFRDFLVHQHTPRVLAMLADGQFLEAEQTLLQLRNLHPSNPMVEKLQGFTRYLSSSKPTQIWQSQP